jgi:hypothetical protein
MTHVKIWLRGEITMKRKLIAVIAVLSLACVTAAGAKSTHKRPPPPRPAAAPIESPEAKYPPTDPYAVWVAGTYVGRDPDPNVRAAMIREFYHNLDSR